MNVTVGSSQQLQEHADLHGAMWVEIYEKLKKKGQELNAKLDEENKQQKEADQLNMTVGEYDEMGTHRSLENSQEEPTHKGPVTRSKSVVSEPNIVDAKQANDIDIFLSKKVEAGIIFNRPYLINNI